MVFSRRRSTFVALPTLALVLLVAAMPAVAATAEVALVAKDKALREALRAGDVATVLDAMKTAPTADRLPGVHAAALLKSGDTATACAVLKADQTKHPERAADVALVLARCLHDVKDLNGERKAWKQFFEGSPKGGLATDPRVLDAAAFALFSGDDGLKALLNASENRGLSTVLPAPNDTDKREAYARFLQSFVTAVGRYARKATAAEKATIAAARAAALKRLYVEFGETTAAKSAVKATSARAYARHVDKDLALERARHLSRRHDNKAIVATLNKHMPKASDKSEAACEARYIVGKAQRKMRRYKGARKNLDFVAKKCTGVWKKRARYMSARVASFQGAKDAVATFDAFVAAYPKDTLADDVLIWKAEHLALRRQKKQAEKVYETLIAQHPNGDMTNTARFDLAFMRARRGDVAGARAALDALARNAIDANVLVADRALYWRARLLAYPSVDSWTLTSDVKARDEGAKALVALTASRPASFYGHLARLVATSIAPDATSALTSPPARQTLDASARVPVSSTLAKDVRFQKAQALHRAGYDAVAIAYLEAIDHKTLSTEDALAITALMANAQGHAESHQVMRSRGLAVPNGQPAASTMALWALSFPKAHQEPIVAAANATKLPPELLFGLAREESAFDAAVVSWAGAVGLTQLMMFTAKEEAQLLKKPVPSVDDLRAPGLNARLGANHLMRRQSLGHPLLAIAAYNAGPGRVKKWSKRQQGPIDAWVESIPIAQTRGYVVKVTGSWVVYSLLDGKPAPVFSLSLPGKPEPITRALKGAPKVDPKAKSKLKRRAPKG